MTSPGERINEKLNETNSIIKEVGQELDLYKLPDYVKDLQLRSFEKRLSELESEKEEIDHLSGRDSD